MSAKKKLIIIQSPADMPDGLSILKSNNSSEVDIAIIGIIDLFNTIATFHSKVIFLSPPALSKGFFRYIFWFYLMKRKNIDFVESYDEIFYPDLLNDVLTSVLVKIAKDRNIQICKYASRYNVLLANNISNSGALVKVISKILSSVLNRFSGMKEFKMIKYNDRYIPYCTIEPDIFLSFDQKNNQRKIISLEYNKSSLTNYLYLDPGPGIHDILINYSEVIPLVLKKLSKNGLLYIKKHPTHPLSLESSILDVLEFSYFEENLPISMINLNDFDRVIAIDSIGLAEVEGSIPISIINLFKARKPKYIDTYIKYISSNSSKEIHFPVDFDSFDGLVYSE